jgi:hypothetical protein
MKRIITTHSRHKRPPRKRKAVAIEAPAIMAPRSKPNPSMCNQKWYAKSRRLKDAHPTWQTLRRRTKGCENILHELGMGRFTGAFVGLLAEAAVLLHVPGMQPSRGRRYDLWHPRKKRVEVKGIGGGNRSSAIVCPDQFDHLYVVRLWDDGFTIVCDLPKRRVPMRPGRRDSERSVVWKDLES